MLKLIYIALVIIISLWTFYVFMEKDYDYQNEMRRIQYIETKNQKKKDYINYNRTNTTPCEIPGLFTPRDCYIDSEYTCKWNERADRCNQII